MKSTCVLAAVGLLVTAVPASAQEGPALWGVAVHYTPTWKIPDRFKAVIEPDATTLDVQGKEFRIGFVRGRTLGGEWGVSYVQKRLNDGSRVLVANDFEREARSIVVRGVSIDKFADLATIKERVQIGLNFGGGIGSAKGTTIERLFFEGTTTEVEGKRFLTIAGQDLDFVPLFRLELAVAGIVAPGLKIRASGGFNYPGTTSFTIGAVALFGER
jgi:hypothetical protein